MKWVVEHVLKMKRIGVSTNGLDFLMLITTVYIDVSRDIKNQGLQLFAISKVPSHIAKLSKILTI